MKTHFHFFATILFFSLCSTVRAQQTSFEGVITYQVDVKSKLRGISDQSVSRMLGLGPLLKVSIKNGFYFQSGGISDEYHDPSQQKVFIKFKQRDTLDYLPYDADTSSILELKKQDKKQTIAGYTCKSLFINTTTGSTTYYYSTDLYQDSVYAAGNTIGHYDVFVKETQSVYLKAVTETDFAVLSITAINVIPGKVNDRVFQVPSLPVKYFDLVAMIIPAENKSAENWMNYVHKNANTELPAKYLEIPTGDSVIKQTALVNFVVQESGQVGEIQIANLNDIHPALAKEAIRLVKESTGWKPATINGLKIDTWITQPVTFVNSK